MSRNEQTYYIARVELHEALAFDGSIITHDGAVDVLGESEGYRAIGGTPHRFKEPPTIEEAAAWDGRPWYKRMKFGTLRVYRVHEVHVHERTEEEVKVG